MTADPRTRMDRKTIANAFRNTDYELEIARLKRSGGGGGGGSSVGFYMNPYGPSVVPVGHGVVPLQTGIIEPAGAFSVTGDGSITVRDAGWYQVSASPYFASNTAGYHCSIGVAPNTVGEIAQSHSGATGAWITPMSGAIKLTAGQKIYVNCQPYTAGVNVQIRDFSIVGISGAKGDVGATGSTGATGATGATGTPGAKWYDGMGPPAGATGINGDYYLDRNNGDVYLKSGGVWNWTGSSLHGTPFWQGDWSSSATYRQGDAVAHLGSSYVAKMGLTGAGQSPTTYPTGWAMMAQKGDTGPQGAQGIQGIPGGTMGASTAKAVNITGGGVANVALGWAGVPLPALTIEPSDAFTVSGNAITVKDAGWYHVAATIFNNQNVSNNLFVALSTSATGADGDIANNGTAGIVFNRCGCDGSVKLAAGGKIYLYGWSNMASPVNVYCLNFSIERVGGPQGVKGNNAEVYEQPTEPAGAGTGAIWIDTDDVPPSGGNVPAGGTAGQILTKVSGTDFAVAWGAAPVSGITGQTYTMSGYAADRVLNAGATTMNEIASVLATLIDDMKAAGLIKP